MRTQVTSKRFTQFSMLLISLLLLNRATICMYSLYFLYIVPLMWGILLQYRNCMVTKALEIGYNISKINVGLILHISTRNMVCDFVDSIFATTFCYSSTTTLKQCGYRDLFVSFYKFFTSLQDFFWLWKLTSLGCFLGSP